MIASSVFSFTLSEPSNFKICQLHMRSDLQRVFHVHASAFTKLGDEIRYLHNVGSLNWANFKSTAFTYPKLWIVIVDLKWKTCFSQIKSSTIILFRSPKVIIIYVQWEVIVNAISVSLIDPTQNFTYSENLFSIDSCGMCHVIIIKALIRNYLTVHMYLFSYGCRNWRCDKCVVVSPKLMILTGYIGTT